MAETYRLFATGAGTAQNVCSPSLEIYPSLCKYWHREVRRKLLRSRISVALMVEAPRAGVRCTESGLAGAGTLPVIIIRSCECLAIPEVDGYFRLTCYSQKGSTGRCPWQKKKKKTAWVLTEGRKQGRVRPSTVVLYQPVKKKGKKKKKLPAKEERHLCGHSLFVCARILSNFLGLQVSRVSMCRASGHVFPPCLQSEFVQPDTLSAEHGFVHSSPTTRFELPASFQAFTSTPRSLAAIISLAGWRRIQQLPYHTKIV